MASVLPQFMPPVAFAESGPSYGGGIGPIPLQNAANVNAGSKVQRDLNRLDMKYFLARRGLINSYLEHRFQQESFLLRRECPPCDPRGRRSHSSGLDASIDKIVRAVEGDDGSTASETDGSSSASSASSGGDVFRADVSREPAPVPETPRSRSERDPGSRRSRRSRRGRHRDRRGGYPILNIASLLRNPFHFMLLNQIDNALADQLIWLRNRQFAEVSNLMATAKSFP